MKPPYILTGPLSVVLDDREQLLAGAKEEGRHAYDNLKGPDSHSYDEGSPLADAFRSGFFCRKVEVERHAGTERHH